MAFEKLKGFMHLTDEDLEITDEEIEREKEKLKEEGEEEKSHRPFGIRASKTDEEYTAPSEAKTPMAPKSINTAFTSTSAFKLVVIEPKSFDECPKLVDSLKGRRPVIINLEKVETETARKIFDFLSGATYALSGNVQKIANNIFIFAPQSVDIALNEGRSFDFGTNKSWKDR